MISEKKLSAFIEGTARINSLQALFQVFYFWCQNSEKPLILLIDEVDTATNNQVFLDFLAQLRAGYLKKDTIPIFQSVILAGVYDIRNLKRKIRPEDDHKTNFLIIHLKKGHMLSFNFNKNKKPGITEISLGEKVLIEAIV